MLDCGSLKKNKKTLAQQTNKKDISSTDLFRWYIHDFPPSPLIYLFVHCYHKVITALVGPQNKQITVK